MQKISQLLLASALTLLAVDAFCAGQEMPSNHPKIELPAQSETHESSKSISGKVLQTMNSGGYSYINIQKKNGEKLWLAVKETNVSVGDKLSFLEGTVMKNFESKTLKRTFDSIIFSNGIIPAKKQGVTSAPKDLSVPTAPTGKDVKKGAKAEIGSKAAVASKEKISVDKATGANAITVEEAFRKSAKLDKKTVVIRGKVVKASTGIMKRTWVHLQDGTGSQAKGTHNLVCTTNSPVNVGDVITVSGTLAKDRDFGAGYKYGVIVENAVISR